MPTPPGQVPQNNRTSVKATGYLFQGSALERTDREAPPHNTESATCPHGREAEPPTHGVPGRSPGTRRVGATERNHCQLVQTSIRQSCLAYARALE